MFAFAGCERKDPAVAAAPPTPPPGPPIIPAAIAGEQPAEPWAKLPPDQWPQMVLTNRAAFKHRTSLQGASAFLLQGDSGTVYAATANHLLGENGGVKPEVPRASLDSELLSWELFPRTEPAKIHRVAGLASHAPVSPGNDWLILRFAERPERLPATPMHLRATPVKVGEQVHLIGVPYSEPTRPQNVYTGKVTARGFGDRFRYNLSPPVDIRGFSGAPIVDDAGLVVGVMTVWFEPKMQGDKMLEAGGEDASVIVQEGTAP